MRRSATPSAAPIPPAAARRPRGGRHRPAGTRRAATLASAAAVAAAGLLAAPGAQAVPPDGTPAAARAGCDLPDLLALPDGFGPEGITDDDAGTVYVTSLRGGGVWAGDVRSGEGEVLLALPGYSLRGAVVDPATGYLWTVGSRETAGGTDGVLLVLDPVAADPLIAQVTLAQAPVVSFPNDLTLAAGGVVVTDSFRDVLYRVPVDAGLPGDAEEVRLGGEYEPTQPGSIALNGIRTLPDGSLLVVDSRDGTLLAVDPATGVARTVPVRGRVDLTGGDGLVLDGRRLYVVRGSGDQVVTGLRVVRTGTGWAAVAQRELTDADLSVPSTATPAAGALYAVNARFGVPTQEFQVVRVELPGPCRG